MSSIAAGAAVKTREAGRPHSCSLAQLFNVVWTLLLAWLIFGGVFVASPTL